MGGVLWGGWVGGVRWGLGLGGAGRGGDVGGGGGCGEWGGPEFKNQFSIFSNFLLARCITTGNLGDYSMYKVLIYYSNYLFPKYVVRFSLCFVNIICLLYSVYNYSI